MLKENDHELKFELLKIILSNPANNIMSINAEGVSERLSVFIQSIRKSEPQAEEKP
jgi:hypothetical protein